MRSTLRRRVYSLDAIRILAMILVIIVHTKYYFFAPSAHSSIYAILKVIGTIGVPLFVILTGYLMLDQNYEDNGYLQKYLKRNLFPLFITYEFWNIAWNILRYTRVVENPQEWKAIAKAAFFMRDTISALWYFRKKSGDKMKEILNSGIVAILVSHSISQVRELCNKILWLDHGHQVCFGDDVKLFCDAYEEFLITKELPTSEYDIKRLANNWKIRKEKERELANRTEAQRLEDLLNSGDSKAALQAAISIIKKNKPKFLV